MEFTREKTNISKGIAICLMFSHHLFAFNYRLLNGNSYVPLIPGFNTEFYIGKFGNICVAMFLFLSGYGLFLGWARSQQSSIRYSLTKLKNFYLTYWLYFLIFVPIGLIFFQEITFWNSNQIRFSRDVIVFLMNFSGWYYTYNGEWWFVRIFLIILLFLCPIYLKLAEKNLGLMVFLSLLLLSFGLRVYPWGEFGFTMWQVSFALGVVCAKLKFFSSRPIQYLDKLGWSWVMFGLFCCFLIGHLFRLRFGDFGVRYDFLILPFLIYFSVRAVTLARLHKIFTYLGEYSFPLWLVHSFFCYYYFQDIIYFPKWPLLVFMLLVTMSLLSVVVIEHFKKRISSQKMLWGLIPGISR
jgi:hypothetical protein